MEQFYIPYNGNRPAVLDINGHRIVLLSADEEALDEHLEILGAEHLHRIEETDFESAEVLLRGLAEAAQAEIIITPPEIEIDKFLDGLRLALPWSH